MLGRDAIAKILQQEGVEWITCFPHNLIIESAAAIGIRPILTRTERVAVNIADGFTRISNGERIGIFLAQAGPGAENAFSGVAQSYADSIPILGLPGGNPRRRTGVHPNFSSPANYQRISKWADQINYADRVPEMMRRAFTYLRSGHPAPVILEVPGDVMDEEMSGDGFDYKPVKRIRAGADPVAVKEAVTAFLKARCPLIHAGQGVLFAQAWDELRELAELLQAPVMTTMPGKSVFPENHPLSAGSGGHTGSKVAAHFLKESDLIFGIGCSFSTSPFAAPIPPGKFVIHSSVDEQDINKDLAVDVAVMGDARLVLQQMIEEAKAQLTPVSRKEGSSTADEVKAIKEEWMQEWMPKFTSNETPINPYRVIGDLMQTVDRTKTIITHEAGGPRDQLVPFWETLVPNSYIGWGKTTTLGYSIGGAMGAKLAQPDKLVVNLMGDASFGMTGMDYETAAREEIPILTIVLKNSVLGSYINYHPIASKKYDLPSLSGEYAKVAEALGAYSETVTRPEDVIPAIKRAQKETESGRPALLECITKEELEFSAYW